MARQLGASHLGANLLGASVLGEKATKMSVDFYMLPQAFKRELKLPLFFLKGVNGEIIPCELAGVVMLSQSRHSANTQGSYAR